VRAAMATPQPHRISADEYYRMAELNLFEPDFALLKPRADFYRHHTATSEDVLLMIEVSESSLRFDLDKKAPLYAKHAIPELWVVDVQGRRVHLFRSLEGKKYRDISASASPGMTAIQMLPGAAIDFSFLRKF